MSQLWTIAAGVVIGGLATVVIASFAQRRRERRALAAATRVALEYLRDLGSACTRAAREERWWGDPIGPPPTEVTALMAAGLRAEEWWDLTSVIGCFRLAEEMRSGGGRPPADALSDMAADLFRVADGIGRAVLGEASVRAVPPTRRAGTPVRRSAAGPY